MIKYRHVFAPKLRTHFTTGRCFAINRSSDLVPREAILTPPLTSEFANQDEVFARAFAILQHAVATQAFPCASVAVTHREKLIALKAFGHFTHEADTPVALPDTIFDLASITKVMATTSMAALLYQRGLLDIETPVVAIIPEFIPEMGDHESGASDPRRREVTLRMLLAHSSGLPAHLKLYEQASTREKLTLLAATTPLTNDPGTHVEYSDMGFIVLAEALMRIADERLDTFCQREIFGPLGLARTGFNPLPEQRHLIPPTLNNLGFRPRLIQGEVNDDNAAAMGGIAGHAGLFAPAQDLAVFARAIIDGGAPVFRRESLAIFTKQELLPPETTRTLGWDTPSQDSLAGKHFSPGSFGHLGFTGTSLWIDPERQISITLLTNRTWPDGKNIAIRHVRPEFHDAVMETLIRL